VNVFIVSDKSFRRGLTENIASEKDDIHIIGSHNELGKKLLKKLDDYMPHSLFIYECELKKDKTVSSREEFLTQLRDLKPHLHIIYHFGALTNNQLESEEHKSFVSFLININIFDIFAGKVNVNDIRSCVARHKTKEEAVAQWFPSAQTEVRPSAVSEVRVEREVAVFDSTNPRSFKRHSETVEESDVVVSSTIVGLINRFKNAFAGGKVNQVTATNKYLASEEDSLYDTQSSSEEDFDFPDYDVSFPELDNEDAPQENNPSDEDVVLNLTQTEGEQRKEEVVEEADDMDDILSAIEAFSDVEDTDIEGTSDEPIVLATLKSVSLTRSEEKSETKSEVVLNLTQPKSDIDVNIIAKENDSSQKSESRNKPVDVVDVEYTEEDFDIYTVETETEYETEKTEIIGNVTIGVAGLISRVGCTHVALELGMVVSEQDFDVGVVLANGETFNELVSYLRKDNEISDEGTSFKYGRCRIYAPASLFLAQGRHKIVVADFGLISEQAEREFERCQFKFLVCDSAPWHIRKLEEYVTKPNKYAKQIHYLVNLIGEERFETLYCEPLSKRGYKLHRLEMSENCFNPCRINKVSYTTALNSILKPVATTTKKRRGLSLPFFK